MEAELNTALTLLITGMITVFFILLLVMLSGKLLINFTNKYLAINTDSEGNIKKAIELAVDKFSNQSAKITNIERLDP